MQKLKIKTNYSDNVLSLELPAIPVRHEKLTEDGAWAEVLPQLQSFSGVPPSLLEMADAMPEVVVLTEDGSLVGCLLPIHEATTVLPVGMTWPRPPLKLTGWWLRVEKQA